MKRFLLFIIIPVLFVSCIKKAPLNPEADIESFILNGAAVTAPPVIDQANRKIRLYLTPEALRKGVAPELTVSPGATVFPASGDSIRFNQGSAIVYTVISESGTYTKQYTIEVISNKSWIFNFEVWGMHPSDKYMFPLEADSTQIWSSGNPGTALAGVDKDPLAYPMRSTSNGLNGSMAAELVTLPGTPLSNIIGIQLMAGSIFLGNFNSANALINPLGATEFGQPYEGLPARFTGYYKYAPGTPFQDKEGNAVPGQTDQCSIYAVLYNGSARLDGTNILTSDRIVASAVLPDGSAKADFTRFDLPFIYSGLPASDTLMLAIVASSSSEGGTYRGAIGSKLIVDSFNIIAQ